MKDYRFFLYIIFAFVFASTGCSTSQSHIGSSKSSDDALKNLDLTNRLKTYAGIRVYGSGASARIVSRGVNSFSDNEPLYILDGNQVSSYADLYSMVNTREIKRVEVLVKPEEIGIYGFRGSNGVVKVTMALEPQGI